MDAMIYLDNHATTRVDPRVVEAMLPVFAQHYGNPSSATHPMGQQAAAMVESARASIASALNAFSDKEITFTSGATESNNLALRGMAERHVGGHIVSVTTEHPSVLGPLEKLARQGFQVTLLPVRPHGDPAAGTVDLNQLEDALREDTFLVSVMLANNEIGVIQPIAQIAQICRKHGIRLHTDATQAVGKMAVDVQQLGVDSLSFSAHKLYGPKGVGGLYVRRTGERPLRLMSQIVGGKQEQGLRGGTLNVSGIVGFAKALALCLDELLDEQLRLARLRNDLYRRLCAALGELPVNGPPLEDAPQPDSLGEIAWKRLPGNLNCQFPGIDGHTLMVRAANVCLSSGSACTATSSEPSHVLKALGLADDCIRSSLRFGIGRFNSPQEIEQAADFLIEAAKSLRQWIT